MTGREFFDKHKKQIACVVKITKRLPKRMRICLLNLNRNKNGNLGNLLRYIAVASLAKKVGNNRCETLKKSILSVINQSMSNIAIVIVDNASTDNTKVVVSEFKDDRVFYYCQNENIGGIGNINTAISLAESPFFIVFHDDDVMCERLVEEEYKAICANKMDALSSRALFLDENGKEINKKNNINSNLTFTDNQYIKFSHAEEVVFASEIGMRFQRRLSNDYLQQPIEGLSNVLVYIDAFKEFKYKLATFVSLVNFLNERKRTNDRELLYGWLKHSLETSHILYQEESYDDEVFVFPKGDYYLDKGEILKPLLMLEDYPKAKKSFVEALKMYNDSDESTSSNVADCFRKALESFFQEFFSSKKSLENMKSEYGSFLQNNGIPKDIANNFETLLKTYMNYNNCYAKHHDESSKNILEYLLYETGNIIRLLLTLSVK